MENPVIKEIQRLTETLGSRQAVAEKIGVSGQYLCDVISNRRSVSKQLAAKLGWEKAIVWRKIKNA